MQSTGYRTTPDVSLVADPATGAWIADPYNLDPSNPFEVVGGTSLSAPAWAGLFALVNQGRAAAGESTLNSASPTETQQALYMLPQSDYNVITSGNNGYTADAGYNLVTGLGTPVANLLVPDLVAYQGPGTSYSGPTVGPLQDAGLVNTGASSSGTDRCVQCVRCVDGVGSVERSTLRPSGRLAYQSLRLRSGQAEAPSEGTYAATSRDSSLVVERIGSPSYNRILAQGTNPAETTAVDQVLGRSRTRVPDDSLIGDLALEQVTSRVGGRGGAS